MAKCNFTCCLMFVALVTVATAGCVPGRSWGLVTKGQSEKHCPTDIRQMHRWCWG